MLIDSHCHLDYFGDEADDAVARAHAAGVDAMLTISTKMETFPTVRAIAARHASVACSVGVHPHKAAEHADLGTAALCELAEDDNVVGIGETGLDYFYEHSPRDAQIACFRAHIQAAQRTGLPLIVHTRDADDDTAAILAEHLDEAPFTGVIHCFSSGRALAERCLELGFHISISGIATFKRADDLRATVREVVPMDRLLVETDAPYLAPVPMRGKRNEPAYVTHTAAVVADLKDVPVQELMDTTSRNFLALFTRAAFGGTR